MGSVGSDPPPAGSCGVCGEPLRRPVYESPADRSVTSKAEVIAGRTAVYFCDRCGHLTTPPLPDLDRYYREEYRILIDSEDEDQLYDVKDGVKTFRADHQVETLIALTDIPAGAKVLDYGCGKGASLRGLAARRPDVVPHLFELGELYVPFWARFCTPDRWAVGRMKAEWRDYFDLVTAYYVLEHVADLRGVVADVAGVLRPGGCFYFVVPNAYTNPNDFVVADHVGHFSAASVRHLLAGAGFGTVAVNETAHRGAFVVHAYKGGPAAPPTADEVRPLAAKAAELAEYWRTFADRVRAFEGSHDPGTGVAVYGSGVYSTLITTCLRDPGRVACYLDQNPHKWGKAHLGKPILPPDDLPAGVGLVYVGLNPFVARAEMAKLDGWRGRPLTYFYP